MRIRPFRFLKRVLALIVGQGDQVLTLTTRLEQIGDKIKAELAEVREAVCGNRDNAAMDQSLAELADAVASIEVKLDDLAERIDELAPKQEPAPSPPAPA